MIEKIFAEDQWEYQSGEGMLLYLVKHLHLDLTNMTRELSKANDGSNPAAYKELLSVIRYVLDMKNLGLKIEHTGNSNKPWEIICFSVSDYMGDPVSRRSISCFILHVLCVLVSLQSKSQKSVLLCSSEAEYVTLSETVKEVLVIQLLVSMKIVVKYPVMVRVDNIGAILWQKILLQHAIPSMWISGTSMLMSMLRIELLR